MPYISEKIRLSEIQDRRRKLTDEQKLKIKEEYGTGLISLNSLAKKYNVSKKLILITVNPDSAEKSKNRQKEHWRDYQVKGEEWAKIQREHRQYKQSLYVKGELKNE